MPIINTFISFIKSKRLAIKSFYFTSVLLLVFISAIIMITNDYPQDASCTNTINGSTNVKSLRTFNSEDECENSSNDTEVLKASVAHHFDEVFLSII